MGNVVRRFVHGARIDEPVLMKTAGGDIYYTMDGLGSISELTNASGNLVESYRYDAYGKTKLYDSVGFPISASSVGNPYYFTGREYDFETGLYYYRARYYDLKLGRFLETDPLEYKDGLNLYLYCAKITL